MAVGLAGVKPKVTVPDESSLGLYQLGLFAAGYGISAGLISAFDSIFSNIYSNTLAIFSGNRLEKSEFKPY